MQKTRTRIPVFLIALPVIASCALRLFLLLRYTDKETGNVVGGAQLTLITYAFIFITILLAALFSHSRTELNRLLDFEKGSRREFAVSIFLALSFFVDFIHQGYNCYRYLSGVSYVEYTYIIPLIISGLLAVICSFYFISYAMTANGSNYDFRNLSLFHFAPIVWGFARLIMMMLKIIDIKQESENVLEFIFLAFMMMFFFSFISMVDSDGNASRLLVFFAIVTFALSLIIVLPRFFAIIIGKADVLSSVTYSCVSYFAIGVFAIILSNKAIKKN